MRRTILVGLVVMASGCGGADVAGTWEATEGEQTYLRLEQDGDELTGESCESEGQDCYDIIDGKLDGDVVTFSYTFEDERVDAELTLNDAGDELSGELRASKCDCVLPHTYVRR